MSNNQQPQGQQNPLSSFGFKPAATSNPSNPNPSGGFGAFGSTPSPFGAAQNNATNTPAAPKAPLFGGGGFGTAQNSNPGAQQSAPAPGGGLFAASSTPQTGSAFGGAPKFGTTSGPGITTTPNPLFGSGSAQPAAPSASAFGGTSSTPAAPSGGLFSSIPSSQPAQSGSTPSGANPAPAPSNFFSSAPKAPSGGLFGGSTSSTTATQPGLNILGASNNNQASGTQPGGSTGTSSTSAPSAPNPLFGNAGSTPTTTPAQPSAFGNFGAKPADTSTQPGATPSSGQPTLPSLFGTPNKPASPAPGAAPSTTPSSSLPSLFANLPKKPETGPALGGTAPSAFSGFPNINAPKDGSKDGEKDAKAGAPAAAGDGSKDTSSAPAPSPFAGFNLGGNKDAGAKPPTAPNAGATAPPVTSVPAPSTLRGKTVEDIVNQWTTELENRTKDFSQFASEVAVWDRTLIENGNYISALYATVLAAESTQASLDQALDHVEHQQRNLTATLDQYEKSASEIFHGPGGIMASTEGLGLADSERDKSYALAANLYTQLDDLSRSLTQMVEAVNGLNVSSGPAPGTDEQEDAISTIAGILNAHLSSLQWIDGALNEMGDKVNDAERKIKDNNSRGGGRADGMNKSRGYGLGSSRR